jgi:dTMP kinase
MRRGKLISIEGIDGAGKTTLAAALAAALSERGIDVRLLREPGGVRAAEQIRELVKDPDHVIGARAETLLYAAARAQLIEEAIEPLLSSGTWVLLDRFIDSSLAYQGGGRRLGVDQVREINAFATGGLMPDRTLLLYLDPALARTRSRRRTDPADRLEREREDFHATIAGTYEELASSDPERIRRLDASQDERALLASALKALEDLA